MLPLTLTSIATASFLGHLTKWVSHSDNPPIRPYQFNRIMLCHLWLIPHS